MQAIDFGNGDDVARNGFVNRRVGLALHTEQVADPHRLVGVDVHNLVVRRELAAHHADETEVPYVAVVHDFEDLAQELGRLLAFQLLGAAVHPHHHAVEPPLGVAGRKSEPAECVQQFLNALVLLGGRTKDRNECTGSEGGGDGGFQFLGGDVAVGQVFFGKRFVGFDNGVDQLLPHAVRVERAPQRNVGHWVEGAQHVAEVFADGVRHVERDAPLPERVLNLRDQRHEVDLLRVEFVHHDDATEAPFTGFVKHPPRVHFDAVGRGDDDDSGFDDGQPFECRTDEIRAAGRVQNVEVFTDVVGVQDVGVDGIVVGVFVFIHVPERRAVVHAAQSIHGMRFKKEGVGEACFPGGPVAN